MISIFSRHNKKAVDQYSAGGFVKLHFCPRFVLLNMTPVTKWGCENLVCQKFWWLLLYLCCGLTMNVELCWKTALVGGYDIATIVCWTKLVYHQSFKAIFSSKVGMADPTVSLNGEIFCFQLPSSAKHEQSLWDLCFEWHIKSHLFFKSSKSRVVLMT